MYRLVMFLLKFVSDQDKLNIADRCLEDVQKSKYYAIPNVVAERLLGHIIRSSGNKVVDFIIKD